MNAASISRPDLIADIAEDSDSDTNSEGMPDYYQPISSSDGDDNNNDNEPILNGFHHPVDEHRNIDLPNGHHHGGIENGVRSMHLSEDEDEEEEEEEEEEEVEEMRRRYESDRAMRRAFEEDESRRNAPLASENAARVMEAMRGVDLSGFAPDWAQQDRWVDQLTRLRHTPRSTA